MNIKHDENYMASALSYARRGLGHVAPNPSVGCVIVKNGMIISRGRTAHGGRPHAEAEALERAGDAAKGSTAYVTLEPCALPGRGGPCSAALIEAGVARVVVACIDPNPAVNGQGIENLKAAGIDVKLGVLEGEAQQFNKGFILCKTENRPFVTLKLATSIDHKIAAKKGERTQISGSLANHHMHLQRSLHDAILIGSETYLADTPQLTTRLDGHAHQTRRFILDRRGRVNAPGFEVLQMDCVADALLHLTAQGVTRLLVEGGAEIHKSFLEAGYVDQFLHTQSTDEIGEDGVEALYIKDLEKYGLKKISSTHLLKDRLDIYTRTD